MADRLTQQLERVTIRGKAEALREAADLIDDLEARGVEIFGVRIAYGGDQSYIEVTYKTGEREETTNG